jgi:DNA-binding response OmpR family regulator
MAWHVVSIDDLAEISELVRFTLHHPDIALHQATNGPSGLTLIRDLEPDLVILDIMLPGMSGWDVYDTIRADEAVAHIPVIILSVLSEKAAHHASFRQSEIDCYMTKPFEVHQLREQVVRMLNAHTLWT